MRRALKIVLGALGLCWGLCGCGTTPEEESTALGRYVEQVVELPAGNMVYTNLVQKDSFIRLMAMDGRDLISVDGGRSFQNEEMTWEEFESTFRPNLLNMAENADGDRILTIYEDMQCYKHMFYSKDGQMTEFDMFSASDVLQYFVSRAGSFVILQENNVYQVDSISGECTFLFESQGYPFYAAADEKLLYVAEEGGIWIYDLENQELKEQDVVLNAFLANETGEYLLYPLGESVYILNRDGLFLYELYSGNMTGIIDGTLCSMGDITKNYVGLAVIETECAAEFLIYYSDGSLLRYVYDETLTAEPESVLKVFGMYEDGNVRQLISGFQKVHPEISVKYEIGIESENSITPEDAMKNLSTEIAAGKGPDVLLMDYLPYRSYVEKGVLVELGNIRDKLETSQYWFPVVDGFKEEKGLYTIPLNFTIPVIGGDADTLEVKTLEELADLLEQERTETPEGSIFSFVDAEGALKLLAQSSMGAWMQEDGTLSREAVEDFLVQSKRIYDAQMAGFTELPQLSYTSYGWGTGENLFERYFGSYGARDAAEDAILEFPGQAFYGGYLSDSKDDLPYFVEQLKFLEGDYALLPGQNYAMALPSTLLSISSTSKKKEESALFIEYALSEEFQSQALLNGIPVNKRAYALREICPHDTRMMYSLLMYPTREGSYEFLEVYWPNDLDFYLFDGKVEDITGVNYCDRMVYEAVLKEGESVLKGENSMEEAMRNIEKSVQLYLSE